MKSSLIRRLTLMMTLALPLTAAAAQRIVSIGGDVTEIAFALGAGDEVIARDSTSLHPAAVKKLPDVGYMRQLNAEGILALKPTLVLTTELAQPALVLKQLADSGVNVVSVPGDTTLQAVPQKIATIAAALQRVEQGKQRERALSTAAGGGRYLSAAGQGAVRDEPRRHYADGCRATHRRRRGDRRRRIEKRHAGF